MIFPNDHRMMMIFDTGSKAEFINSPIVRQVSSKLLVVTQVSKQTYPASDYPGQRNRILFLPTTIGVVTPTVRGWLRKFSSSKARTTTLLGGIKSIAPNNIEKERFNVTG